LAKQKDFRLKSAVCQPCKPNNANPTMKRRVALRNMAAAVGGLVSLPAWADRWNAAAVRSGSSYLSPKENDLLADIAETIIPATDTPGAKELDIHRFIQKIVADCMDKKSQEKFTKGLGMVSGASQQKFAKDFAFCNVNQRATLLKEMESSTDETAKEFYSTVKGLTIEGYLTSEYVMTNLTHYQMAPGYYHGCVPVTAK
jgi:Gluconate 2-dehydrogenase subunit 3